MPVFSFSGRVEARVLTTGARNIHNTKQYPLNSALPVTLFRATKASAKHLELQTSASGSRRRLSSSNRAASSAGRIGGEFLGCVWWFAGRLCCRRKGVRLQPIETELDEEAQEKVEQLQGTGSSTHLF